MRHWFVPATQSTANRFVVVGPFSGELQVMSSNSACSARYSGAGAVRPEMANQSRNRSFTTNFLVNRVEACAAATTRARRRNAADHKARIKRLTRTGAGRLSILHA